MQPFLFLKLILRKRYGKGGPFVLTCGVDGSAVESDNLLCNGKSQTGSARICASGLVKPEELFKNRIQLFSGNGLSLIDEADKNILLPFPGIDLDGRIGIAVGDGIF